MRKDDAIRLRHMLEAAQTALSFVYFNINLDIVWRTVTEELPNLVAVVQRALDSGFVKGSADSW